MSRMKEYLCELEEDFECLTATSMEWNPETWAEQCSQDRFIITSSDWQYTHIYWFENYVSVVAAKGILREMGEEYKVHFDTWTGEWVLLSKYTSNVWKGL